jgi:hypothetical protein
MRTICYVIHHRNDLVPQHLTAEEVLQIVTLVNKYDLKVALKSASVEWLKPGVNAETKEMWFLLAAAFLLDDAEAFKTYTITLILYWTGPYSEFVYDGYIGQILPPILFSMQ